MEVFVLCDIFWNIIKYYKSKEGETSFDVVFSLKSKVTFGNSCFNRLLWNVNVLFNFKRNYHNSLFVSHVTLFSFTEGVNQAFFNRKKILMKNICTNLKFQNNFCLLFKQNVVTNQFSNNWRLHFSKFGFFKISLKSK